MLHWLRAGSGQSAQSLRSDGYAGSRNPEICGFERKTRALKSGDDVIDPWPTEFGPSFASSERRSGMSAGP
jgi:hypothetical protein